MHTFAEVRQRLVRQGDPRSPERLWAHYELEVRLAERLRHAPAAERGRLYGEVYDELFATIYDHSQFRRKDDGRALARRFRSIKHYLKPGITFLEVGAGDGKLSQKVSEVVGRAIAVDVTDRVAEGFELVLSSGIDIPVPSGSVDLAYSHDLLEHLHPDDACAHVAEVARVLRPGGKYLCGTPNRLNGPHDISRMLDPVATGFHLKEYSFDEVRELLEHGGFATVTFDLVAAGYRLGRHPAPSLAQVLPKRLRNIALRIHAVASK
jgi:SAM-dependent methyltransferase